jgi:hypothetical protein
MLCAACALSPARASAQAPAPQAPPDSAAGGLLERPEIGAERAVRHAGPVPRPWHEQPWSVMMRSALVPGWGQAKNGKWVKAGLAVGIEGWAIARIASAWGYADQALELEAQALAAGDAETAALARADYDDAYNRRATAAWILAAAVAASMLDAYIDAHFEQFDADFGPDPTLRDDATGAGGPAAYVGLRFAFTGPRSEGRP